MKIKKSKIGKPFFMFFLITGFLSAHGQGLPGEFIISQQWRDVLVKYSPLTNAAFLSNAEYTGVQLSQAFTVENTFQLTEGVFVFPYLKHTFALSYEGAGAGKLDATTPVESQGNIDIIANGKLSDRSNSFLLSYAFNVWKGLNIGINSHFVYNEIFGKKRKAFGGDIGISYSISKDSIWGNHTFGISTQNILLKGDVKYAGAAVLSYAGELFKKHLDIELYIIAKDLISHSDDFIFGKEKNEFDVSFKAGTWVFNFLKFYGQIGSDYAGGSAGIHAPTLNKGRDLTLMYQFLFPFRTEFPSHSIFMRSEFGDSRKLKMDKKITEKMDVIPYDLYNKAMKLFSEGQYWEAYFIFSRIVTEYPKFFKNDFVSLYSSICFERLDIREAAVSQYQRSMIKYPKSKIHPLARMGIMNVYYRQGNHNGVDEMFRLLSGPHTIDSLRYHAYYLKGETLIKENKYKEAIDVLSKIPETHQDYIYARHSMAVCASIEDGYQIALGYLEDCLGPETYTNADREMVNRTYLLIGYLLYEENELANAVAALKLIPKESFYYEDALLGIGWIALRSGKWDDCTFAGRNLIGIATSDVIKAEGELLQAYVCMMNKDYQAAAQILNEASVRLNTFNVPSKSELEYEKEKYNILREEYDRFGNSVEELAARKYDAEVIEIKDSMHIDQKEFVRAITEKQNFFDTWNRKNFFARNYGKVREDVDYALACVLKIINQSVQHKELEKNEKKEEKLNKEIEKLKNKIEP
jgi:tetratricopeptide (TPR) repeat protein